MPFFHRHAPHRPDWWPENEPWPPKHRRFPFGRRLGCAVVLVNLVAFCLLWLGLAWVAKGLGLIDFPRPHYGGPGWGPITALAVLFLFGLAAGAGFALRRIAAPMDDLLAGAERVAQGDYTVPVPERGPKEARTLTRAFNSMVSRLNETDTRRRSLLADVSHELRTPLTVIRGNLEGMVDGVYAPNEANLRALIDETQMMERLVEDLRTLALAESGALMLRREPTDLALLLSETAYALQPAQGQALIKVACSNDLPTVLLDPARMREVLTNLLTNAIKHSPPGGEILVSCQLDPANPAEAIVIEVQDQGPGIAPADLPHIFDRFYKSSDSTGMGLGLSIARQLAAAHGGSLEAVSRPAPGACFRIVLPQE